VYSVALCCSVYCLCVTVQCTTATGLQPNWSKQIYHKTDQYHLQEQVERQFGAWHRYIDCALTAARRWNTHTYILYDILQKFYVLIKRTQLPINGCLQATLQFYLSVILLKIFYFNLLIFVMLTTTQFMVGRRKMDQCVFGQKRATTNDWETSKTSIKNVCLLGYGNYLPVDTSYLFTF
jgi:hypothetical protein